jgi:hypothetical protein
MTINFNPLNTELNPICHLLALLGAHHILHVSRIRVNFNVSTFREQFRWMRLRPRGPRVGIPQCPAIAQITVRPVELCLSVHEAKSFHFYGTRLSVNHFMLKYVLYIIKKNLHVFLCFCSYFMFFYWYFISSWNHTGISHWRWVLISL